MLIISKHFSCISKMFSYNLSSSFLSNVSRVNEYSDNEVGLKNFELDKEMKSENIIIIIETNEKSSVAFVFNCEQLSPKFKYSIVFSAILLVFVYVLIMFELTHR